MINTYRDFYDSFTPEQLADWAYEGIRIRDLYNENLILNTPPAVQTYPDWVIDILQANDMIIIFLILVKFAILAVLLEN